MFLSHMHIYIPFSFPSLSLLLIYTSKNIYVCICMYVHLVHSRTSITVGCRPPVAQNYRENENGSHHCPLLPLHHCCHRNAHLLHLHHLHSHPRPHYPPAVKRLVISKLYLGSTSHMVSIPVSCIFLFLPRAR